jgi:hypothetical protein
MNDECKNKFFDLCLSKTLPVATFLMLNLFSHSAFSQLKAACPTAAAEWIQFRDQSAMTIVRGAGGDDNAVAGNVNASVRAIAKVFATCYPQAQTLIQNTPHLAEQLAHLKGFAETRKNEDLPGWQLGFNVPDAQYFRDTGAWTDVPAELQDQTLLQAFSDPARIDEGLKILENLNAALPPEKKMIFFRYTSQHLATPDESQVYGRVLIVVPGDPERWVQFGVPEVGKPKTKNLSVVAVKTDANGDKHVYLKDHYRMVEGGQIHLRDRFDATHVSDNCTNCHKSGVLPIFPKPGSFSPLDAGKIDAVNKRFKTYLPADFGGYIDLTKLGIGIGPVGPAAEQLRTADFMKICAGSGTSPESVQRIKSSMTCAKCHNTDDLGELNYPVNRILLKSFVLGGKMPPKNDLTAPERQGLVNCLEAEYFGVDNASPNVLLNWFKSSF